MVEAHDESYSVHVDNLGEDIKNSLSNELVEEYRRKYSMRRTQPVG